MPPASAAPAVAGQTSLPAASAGPRSTHPTLIQGGMGAAVSSWPMAAAVARVGQLGVVSGTALDTVLVRRLQDGDPGGHMRRAMAAFPAPDVAARVTARFFRPQGRPAGTPYVVLPKLGMRRRRTANELSVIASFVEVWLAKDGHDGLVGINLLEKIQMATPSTLYGALLAGVDHVLMGAGIPRDIPDMLDRLAEHQPVKLPVEVSGAAAGAWTADLDPTSVLAAGLPSLKRPTFLAIISAHVLATYLARDERIRPDGFVVEGHRAGGHNAPPRGRGTAGPDGDPVFGPRDEADLATVAATGLPFWLAGAQGTPEAVAHALTLGAQGVQVGTLFALSLQSGLEQAIRTSLLDDLRAGKLTVRTDARASPTGFPFKVATVTGSLTDPGALEARTRVCDMGYLRTPFIGPRGTVGYRCPSEPVDDHLRHGGALEETVRRSCLCNSLMANVGLGQVLADGSTEKPLVTLGSDVSGAERLAELHPDGWSAADVVEFLLPREPG